MERFEYIVKRCGKAVILIILIALLNFLLIRLAPGDPAFVIAGESGSVDPLFMAQLRAEFKLDQPLWVQISAYLQDVLRFDLGYSYRNKAEVIDLIMARLPATLLLTVTGFLLAVVGGVFLGAVAARKVGSWLDSLIGVLCMTIYAMPLYWVGLALVLIFAGWLEWLPAFGNGSVQPLEGWDFLWDRITYLTLPALTLALHYIAVYARLTRSSMLEVQGQDFVKLARAKGLPPLRITTAHVLRNSLLPIVTFAGIQAGNLIGGSILVETVFAWPGIGRLALDSLLVRDYNTLLGVFFLCSVMTIACNLIADVVYSIIDPRIDIQK